MIKKKFTEKKFFKSWNLNRVGNNSMYKIPWKCKTCENAIKSKNIPNFSVSVHSYQKYIWKFTQKSSFYTIMYNGTQNLFLKIIASYKRKPTYLEIHLIQISRECIKTNFYRTLRLRSYTHFMRQFLSTLFHGRFSSKIKNKFMSNSSNHWESLIRQI